MNTYSHLCLMLPRPDKQHSVPARSQQQLRNQQRTPSSKNHFLLLQVRIFENTLQYLRNRFLPKFCQIKYNFQLFQFPCLAPLSRRGEEMRTMSIFLQQLLLKMSKRCAEKKQLNLKVTSQTPFLPTRGKTRWKPITYAICNLSERLSRYPQ